MGDVREGRGRTVFACLQLFFPLAVIDLGTIILSPYMNQASSLTAARMCAILLALLAFIPDVTQAGEYLYSADFNPPINQADQLPAVGQGLRTPSSIIFGEPTVVSAFGHLTNYPLVFTALGYEQIGFALGKGASDYFVEFDVETRNLNGSSFAYSLLFDTPNVQNFVFHGGIAAVLAPSSPPLFGWSDNELHHVRIEIDLGNGTWRLELDNLLPAMGSFYSSGGDIQSVRFNLSGWRAPVVDDSSVQVAIDNVRIGTSGQPAPPQVVCSIPDQICPGTQQSISASVQTYSTNPLLLAWQIDGVTVQTNLAPSGLALDGVLTALQVPLSAGRHLIELTASTGDSGPQACSKVVQVGSATPPVISMISSEPKFLWPPNGRMIPVRIDVQASQDCGGVASRILQVSRSDAKPPKGRDLADADWRITGDLTVELRADRGSGPLSREYNVVVECRDSFGNTSTGTVKVRVGREE
jgi:hypothetical protein